MRNNITYGDDCPVARDKKHIFNIISPGLLCKNCYRLISYQEDLYQFIMVENNEF